MTRKSRLVATGFGGAMILIVLAFVFYPYLTGVDRSAQAQSKSPPRNARTASVKTGDKAVPTNRPALEGTRRTTSQPAHIVPYEQTDLHAKVSGFVAEVHVDIGDHVMKDQILATLWIPEMEQEHTRLAAVVEEARSAVDQAKASIAAGDAMVAAARAQVHEAEAKVAQHDAEVAFRKIEHERFVRLSSDAALNGSLVDEKLNQLRCAEAALAAAKAGTDTADAEVRVQEAKQLQAQADLANAQARLKVTEANYRRSEILLDYRQIRAPYPAVVARRLADTGDFVTAPSGNESEPLFVVARIDKLRIIADIPEAESSLVSIGQSVTLVVDAIDGRTFPGEIVRSAEVLDPRTRTLRIEASLADEHHLRPGMFGMLTVAVDARPKEAARE